MAAAFQHPITDEELKQLSIGSRGYLTDEERTALRREALAWVSE